MTRTRTLALAVLAGPALLGPSLLAGCSASSEAGPATTTVVVTPHAAQGTPTSTSAVAEPAGQTAAGPTSAAPESGPAIASCGDPALHQRGTTFYADGTSGWTEYCGSVMDATPVTPQSPSGAGAAGSGGSDDTATRDQEFADQYWATHPKLTYDPDSADGFGPNQELPPACLRLQGVHC